MKIWNIYDWNQITSHKDSGCDNCKLLDTYPTLIEGEHICLLKIFISKNRMKQNDENLSELELKLFWYKLLKKGIYTKMDLIISFSTLNHFWWTKDQIEGNKCCYKAM